MQKEYSKPQLTRWDRQKRINRISFIVGLVVIVAVLAIVGTGYYLEQWKPLNTTILTVNDQKFTMTDYLRVLRAMGKEDSSNLTSYAGYVLPYMEQSELLYQGADKLGITVSDSDVKAALKENKLDSGYYMIERARLLANKLVEGHFSDQIAKTANQVDINAIFAESLSAAQDLKSQLQNGSDFGELAASESLDYITKNYKGDAGMHPQDIFPITLASAVPGDYAFAEDTVTGAVSQPLADTAKQKAVGYWLIYVIEQGTGDNEGKTNFRVMLLASEEEAKAVKSELDAITDTAQLNEKFTEIAKAKSQYKNASTDGGLLGMTAKGTMGDAFDAVAFDLAAGQVSDPVQDTAQTTKGGYWIVKAVEKAENKDLTEDDISQLAQQKYTEWFGIEQADAEITENLSDEAITWAVERVAKEL